MLNYSKENFKKTFVYLYPTILLTHLVQISCGRDCCITIFITQNAEKRLKEGG